MSEEIRQIPEEFKKVVPDFINDIKTTFPEYVPIINQWWVSNTFDEPEMTAKIEKVFNHCLGIFPERFFDILYKNAEIFNKDSDVNTEFLPGLSFKYLWNFDISDNTKAEIKVLDIMKRCLDRFYMVMVNGSITIPYRNGNKFSGVHESNMRAIM
jgi:hypothetical protein